MSFSARAAWPAGMRYLRQAAYRKVVFGSNLVGRLHVAYRGALIAASLGDEPKLPVTFHERWVDRDGLVFGFKSKRSGVTLRGLLVAARRRKRITLCNKGGSSDASALVHRSSAIRAAARVAPLVSTLR